MMVSEPRPFFEGVLGGVVLSESGFFAIAEAECLSGLGSRSAGNGDRSGGRSKGFSELEVEDLEACALVSMGFVGGAFLGCGDAAVCEDGLCDLEGDDLIPEAASDLLDAGFCELEVVLDSA
jgi:hypothetical protein